MTAGQFQHVYLSAHGVYTESPWTDEVAQMGVRISYFPSGQEPAKGMPFDHETNHGDIDITAATVAGTNGVLTQGWSARLGPLGSLNNVDSTHQIDLAEDFYAYLVSLQNYQSSKFRWTHIKIAPQDSVGKYGVFGEAPQASVYDLTAPVIGGYTSDMMPPEVAIAMSLRAPISGRRGRGRMYLPALAETLIDGNGEIQPVSRGILATNLATFVGNLDNAPGLDVYTPIVCVTSAGKASAVRPSEVRVGSHFDVQKRRQDQASETYSVEAL